MRNIKKLLLLILVLIIPITFSGCKTVVSKNETKNQKKIQSEINSVSSIEKDIQKAESVKNGLISNLSWGIQYSLNNSDNVGFSLENIKTATLLNKRILSLSGQPNINDMKTMEDLVDKLNSTVITLKAEGQAALDKKDAEIMSLLSTKKTLEDNLLKANKNLILVAQKQAESADNNKMVVDTVNSYWGLGAIYYGLKRFITTGFITIVIIMVLYLVLRILSTMNPIASALFNVIETAFSYLVKLLKLIAPNSTTISGLSETTEVNKYKNTLISIVDSIETLQANLSDSEKGNITLKNIMTEFSKNMNSDNKTIINEIKSDLKW